MSPKTTFETLLLATNAGVATLTLNRPGSLNALSPTMADELWAALTWVRSSSSIRVLVLQGAGDAFCAGGDVRTMHAAGVRTTEETRASMERYRRLVLTLWNLDQPVIAAADGVAYGAGFSLLLLCDIVLLSERARLCMAFQRIGLLPDCGALFTLPRVVGLQRAKELMLSGREIGAREAQAMGIALEVLPIAQLFPRAQAMAKALCDASPEAMPLVKRALNQSQQSDLETMLALEASGQGTALTSDYLMESALRFTAKQPRQFNWPQG